ncbi:MAG: hypothetical protein R3Y43_01360 [Alphaproteobacteria bacterium]
MKRNFETMKTIFSNAILALEKKDNIQISDIVDSKNKDEVYNFNLMIEDAFFNTWIDPLDKIQFISNLTGKGERFFNLTKNQNLLEELDLKYSDLLSVLSTESILEKAEWIIKNDTHFHNMNIMYRESGEKISYKDFCKQFSESLFK